MIVIVTGGRSYNGTGLVEALDALEKQSQGFQLIVGDCTGADKIARQWARGRPAEETLVVYARWQMYGKAAGPRRNADMVATAIHHRDDDEPIICLAAPGGRGTADCVRRCREAGFEVREVTT